MTEETNKPYNQSTALKDILLWVSDRAPWQKEAVRRLVSNGSLSSDDIDELEQICLHPESTVVPNPDIAKLNSSSMGRAICLTSIEKPIGINALANDQSLRFSDAGLNIVYGDNGSGKSGYVRILKHACRSRDEKFEILSDVSDDIQDQQTATLRFKEDDTEHTFEWATEKSANSKLRAVSIFDSRSANTHVEATNNVAYIPFPMLVLERLASACDEIKQRIETKITNIQQQTPLSISSPNLSSNTPAGSFVSQISEKSNLETLELLANLHDEEKRKLATLDADLAQDPKKVVAKLNALKTRVRGNIEEITILVELASETNHNRLSELKKQAENASKISKAASEELFSASPLPEIGGELWKTLWEAARRYSDVEAYPNKTFPNATVAEDLCVLCQQPLDETAVARRFTFEEFIKSSAQKDEKEANLAYSNALDGLVLTRTRLRLARAFPAMIKDELDDAELAGRVRHLVLNSLWRIRTFKKGGNSKSAAGEIPTQEFEKHIEELELRITQLSADENSEDRLALVAEQSNLRDRARLMEIKSDVIAEIGRRKEISSLKKALRTTTKRPVTDKNKELSDKLVTDALRGRFAREVEKLKIGTMPIELNKVRDRNAQSFFRVDFVGLPGKPIGEVLSEGEHRCVALAAFLAELVTSRDYSGIVFDDPMSSLDHLYRKNVAKRLIEEAEHRQVVVFTHDLSFLFELSREAEAQEIEVHYQNVRKKQDKPGFVFDEQPMKAKSAGQLANAIQSELKLLKGSFDNLSDLKRTIQAKGIIEQLREAWDQGIADFIHPVLGRFDSHVKGSSLFRLVVLTEEDVRIVTEARSRLSEDLHASPETLNPAEVTHAALSDEVKKLIDWVSNMKTRQTKAVKPRITFT